MTEAPAARPSALARFLSLTWAQRSVVLEAAALIAMLRIALSVLGVRRVQRGISGGRPIGAAADVTAADRTRAAAIARLVDVASHRTVSNTCLHRSLALWWMLGRRGLASELRFGTRRQGGRFEAHAWVEYGGETINDGGGDDGYAPLVWPPLSREA